MFQSSWTHTNSRPDTFHQTTTQFGSAGNVEIRNVFVDDKQNLFVSKEA